jgi:hypothetical protein
MVALTRSGFMMWTRRCNALVICAVALAFVWTARLEAGPTTQPGDVAVAKREQAPPQQKLDKLSGFMRFVDQGATGGRLETADVVFVNENGAVVRLVSAVHIGEASYFKGLADSFKERDCVLYELVKPKDAAVPIPGVPRESTNAIAQLQGFLKDTLNLQFQLDQIDYSAPNFVHADLDAETFTKMQEERGETFAQLMLQQLMKAMTAPPPAADPQAADEALEDLIRMFTRPDMERQVKRFIAKQLGQMEEHALGLDGPNGSVIVTERNKAAMKVLENVLKDGKRDIAIFYGAAHMPDFVERLKALGFKPVATEWRMAWDLNIRYDEPSAVEKMLMDVIKGFDEAGR